MPEQRKVTVDLDIPITPDEAVELCLHHVMLAAAYFEATPDDENVQINEEADRMFLDKNIPGYVPANLYGVRHFLAALLEIHTEMKTRD